MCKRFVNPIFFSLWWCVVFFIFLIWFLRAPALAETKPPVDLSGKNVLVLHAWEANLPMSTETNKALARVFSSGGIPAFNQSFECLDLRRNPGPEYKKLLAEKIRLQYGHRKPDLIIAINPIAMRFATDDCRDVFADIPILALMLPPGFQVPKTSRRVISHFPSLDIVGTLDIALKLVPHAKRVYVACGSYETDIAFENQVRRVSKKWEGRLQFAYLSSMPFDDMLAAVSKAPPDSIVLTLGFARDVSGKLLTTPTAIRRLSQVSAAPVFGIADVALGYGIVGGFLSSYEFIGTKAGELVLDILRGGTTEEHVPDVLDVPCVPMFDWRELKRWKLSEAVLPKGSIVINRETTVWDFRYYIIGGIIFCLAETALIIILIAQRRRRRSAEEFLRQKTEELDQFFNVNLDLLCIANTDGYFLRLNPAWERIFGYSREELMAKQFLDFVHPDDLDRTWEAISTQASSQKVFLFENRYRCKDGTYRWLEWNSVPVGKLIYAAARDVTENKRAEEELKKSEERFRMLVESMNEGLGVINKDGVWTYVNDQLCWILGGLPGDIVGRPFNEFLDKPNQKIFKEVMEKQQNGNYFPYEITWTCGKKLTTIVSPKPIFSDGKLKEVFAVFTDITDRKRAEDALEDRLRFEQFVSEISARFLNVASLEIDREIEIALKGIMNFFHVDRCVLIKGSPDERTALITHAANADDLSPVPPGGNLYDAFPWTSQMMAQGEIINATTIDALPTDASVEKEFYRNLGVRSLLMVPMHTRGLEGYSISISSDREKRVWPEDYIKRLELIGKIFVNTLERNRAEELLRKAEEKYRSIFEGALEGIFETSTGELALRVGPTEEAQHNTINPALARMLGYDSVDEITSFIDDAGDQVWVNPNDRAAFGKMVRERNVVRGFECQLWRKDRTKIWVSINAQQVYGPDGETVSYSGFIEDITDRKKAEEALRESEERFRQVAENVGDFIWEVDANGLYSYTSPSVEKILGYRPEELVGKKHFYDLFVPGVREELRNAALKGFAEKESFRAFPNPNLRKDGKIVHLETSGRPILDGDGNLVGYRGADTDVTERKFAEEAMQERLRFERMRSDLSAKFVDILPDRVDTEINRALKEILEFFQVDRCALIRILPGKGSWQITHLAISEGVPQVPIGVELSTSTHPWVYHKLIEKGEIVSVSGFDDLPAEANADKQTWIGWGIRSTLSIPILISEGTAHVITLNSVKSQTTWREDLFPRLRLLGEIFVNALKRKQSEMEVNRARQQLLHVERSARLGELTASLAHELNQPLAAILSNAQAALRFLQSDQVNLDEFREILNDIVHDDQRAGNVIRSLRSMMKREERERNPVILNNVLNDVTQIFRTESIFRNVHIETEFDESLPPILADKIQLQQVMLNLIVNAADAMSQSPPERRKIILRTQVKDDKIRVTIRDFGPGINKGDLDRIFQPFFTTKGTGLGMGLAVSETIVEAHGGRIWAENSADAGATFFIELPIMSKE